MARPHELVLLSGNDREILEELCSKGNLSARVMKRAEILLLGDDCYTVDEIAEATMKSSGTVRNIRKRYITEGLDGALYERPRSGKPPQKINNKEAALIASIACSDPPVGRSSWSLRMIGDKFVELSEVESISHETIRQVLKKTS